MSEVKLPAIWTDEKHRWEEAEKKVKGHACTSILCVKGFVCRSAPIQQHPCVRVAVLPVNASMCKTDCV